MKTASATSWLIAATVAFAALAAYGRVVVYPEYDARIERDYAYAVCVTQGAEQKRLVVYNHCEKSALTKRTRGGDVNRRFCEFAFDGGTVRVDIAVCEDVKSYAVFPSRLGLKSAFRDGVLSVWLDKPALFGVRLNDYDKTILSVFAEAPEDPSTVPQKGSPGVMYVEGWVDPPGEDGVTFVADPVKEVYIAPGAVLNSRVVVKSRGARIHGRGMILDPFSDIFRFDQTKNTRRGFLNVYAPDVTVEDVKLVDARTFNYCSWAKSVDFRNVKALSSMMCSDGLTFGGSDFRVEGAWLYVGDNALVISGTKDARLRDVAIGTSCNAIFPQGSNDGVVMENIDIFRADEGCIKNTYNGVLRRNTKWNEMNAGEAKKEPGPQDLKHQTQDFFVRNLSAIDCVLFSRFFVGGNMGTLPKTFAFENLSVPFCTGKDDWRTVGEKSGVVVNILHDSKKWLDTTGYVLALTNFWMGGSRMDTIPAEKVVNGDRIAVSVVNTAEKSAIPVSPDRHVVSWTCPWKAYVGSSLQRDMRIATPGKGERHLPAEKEVNLLADRASTRSAWQRCPSWLVKFDATGKDGASRVYRLRQCEKGAGMLNVVTDGFLQQGNGTYRLAFEARAKGGKAVALEAYFLSNEKQKTAKFSVPSDGEWHAFSEMLELDFDRTVTELGALGFKVLAPVDELCFKNLSLSKGAAAGALRWEPLHEPGVGGAIVSVQVSPHDSRHILAGGDMLGTGVSFDGGETWLSGMGLSTYEMASATFHPTRANEVWIGSCSGPYKSMDGGHTWEWKRKGMPAPARNRYTMMIEKVLFDPDDPSRMLAFSGSSRRWERCRGFGAVWESSDGGESWSQTGTVTTNGWTAETTEGANIVRAFWGAKPRSASDLRQVHLVADGAGWFSSMDGGRTWRHRTTPGVDGPVASVTAHPSDSRVFWLVTSPGAKGADGKVPPGGIYKTVDGGRAFTPSDVGIARRGGTRSKLATHFNPIAVAETNPNRLYASDASWNAPAIWKSDDGGATWQLSAKGRFLATAGFAGLSGFVCAAPRNADIAYFWNTEFILRTLDGGKSWSDVSSFRPDPVAGPDAWRGRGWTGWCSQNVAFNPFRKGQCALQAMDAGHAWISSDGLKTWRYAKGSGTPWCGGQSIDFAPDGRIYVATGQRGANAGILVSPDGGATWRTFSGAKNGLPETNGGTYGAIFADRRDSRRAFVLMNMKIFETSDGGDGWTARELGFCAQSVVRDTKDCGRFYIKTEKGILVTRDWRRFDNLGLGGRKTDGKIACDAKGRVLVCRGRTGDKRGLWRYDPSVPEKGWKRLTDEPLTHACATDPADARRIVICTYDAPYHDFAGANGVSVSSDDGATWKRVDEDLPIRRATCVAFDPFDSETIIVGTGGGGFFRTRWPR